MKPPTLRQQLAAAMEDSRYGERMRQQRDVFPQASMGSERDQWRPSLLPPGPEVETVKETRMRATIERETEDGGTETILHAEGSPDAVMAAVRAALTPRTIITRETPS